MDTVYAIVNIKKLKEPGKRFLPILPEKDREVLKQDIIKNGIQVPLIVSKDFVVIDGCNRRLIAAELGLPEIPIIRLNTDSDEADCEELTLRMNLHRRHLSQKQHFDYQQRLVTLAAKRLVAGKSSTIRKIAEESGIPKSNVDRILQVEKAISKYPDLKEKPATTVLREYKRRENIEAIGSDQKTVEQKRKQISAYVKEIADQEVLEGLRIHISYFATSDVYRAKVADIAKKIDTGEVEKPNNPAVEIILAYKKIYGFHVNDKTWNKVYLPQFVETASMLLAEFDNSVDEAVKCIEYTAKDCRANGWEWSLKTCLKRLHHYRKHLANTGGK
jgi:ParB-like chromosome segregation protein Spo0J